MNRRILLSVAALAAIGMSSFAVAQQPVQHQPVRRRERQFEGQLRSELPAWWHAGHHRADQRKAENYKVTTNTATIGIRGSAFSARVNPDGTLDVAGEQDGIEVCTNAGCVSLVVGEIVRVDGPPRYHTSRSKVALAS